MCNCISATNEVLAEHDFELENVVLRKGGETWCMDLALPIIRRGTNGKRKGDRSLLTIEYCPFCGKKTEYTQATEKERNLNNK